MRRRMLIIRVARRGRIFVFRRSANRRFFGAEKMAFIRKLKRRFGHDNLDSFHPRQSRAELVTIQRMERILHYTQDSKSFYLKVNNSVLCLI